MPVGRSCDATKQSHGRNRTLPTRARVATKRPKCQRGALEWYCSPPTRPRKLRAYLIHAVQLDPTNVAAYYHLSQASRKAGDVDAATAEMAEFLKRKAARDNLRRSFDDLPIEAQRLSEQDQSVQSNPH